MLQTFEVQDYFAYLLPGSIITCVSFSYCVSLSIFRYSTFEIPKDEVLFGLMDLDSSLISSNPRLWILYAMQFISSSE